MIKKRVNGVLLGQALSLLNTSTGVFSELLLEQGIATPLFQLVWNYFFISLIYLPLAIYMKLPFKASHLKKYLVGVVFDTQANFLVVLAYQLTSVVSVFTLMNSSVVFVFVLSSVFLKTRYSKYQFLGAGVCLSGVVSIVASDLHKNNWEWGGGILGDVLVIAGAGLYSASNVWVEYLMKEGHTPQNYLSVLGVAGTLITLVESLCLELSAISEISNFGQIGCYVGFGVALTSMYSISPYYFLKFGAIMYNLSLLTTMTYGLLVGILLFDQRISWLYILGFCLVIVGIVVFNKPQKETEQHKPYLSLN